MADHSRVIRDIAREVLAPLGLRQTGRSRQWIDDRVWHLIVVVFDSSGFEKASEITVAVTWLWHAKDHASFDWPDNARLGSYARAGEPDWEVRIRQQAELAARRVAELRAEVADLWAADRLLRSHIFNPGWPLLSAATAAGLVGESESARRLFDQLLSRPATYPWEKEMQRIASERRDLVADGAAFRASVVGEIRRCRQALSIEDLSAGEVEAALMRRGPSGARDLVTRLIESARGR